MVAPINSTDGTTTIYDSEFIYPICPDILAASIAVEGEDDATTIDIMGGTLQMIATLLPTNAKDSTVTWSVDDEDLATIDAMGILTSINNGEVLVTATANDGSGVSGSATITISNQTISVDEVNKAQVKLYPNPSVNQITIEANASIDLVNIYNVSGHLMESATYSGGAKDITRLESGIYFIEVHTGDDISRLRFIKK
jgi:hypothetical protein